MSLADATAALQDWLFEAALPLWWRAGADRGSGGFHEAIAFDGTASSDPRRSRVRAMPTTCGSSAPPARPFTFSA